MRRPVVLVLAVVAFLALLLGLIGIYPREPVRRAVESRLRLALGPGASVRGVHVLPGALRADVDGLVLDTTSFRLEIPRLELGLRASTFTGAGLQLRSLIAHRPILRIKAPDPKAPPTEPARIPPLLIAGLDVRDATVIVELGGGNGILESRGIKASGGVGAGALVIEAPRTTWTREKAVDLGGLTARIATDSALRARVEVLRFSKGRSRLAALGELGTPAAFQPNVRFRGEAHLADFGELLSLAGLPNARGEASFEGTLSKVRDDVQLSLEAKGRNVGVADVDTQSFDVSAVHKGGTSTARLAANVFGGRVEASGSLNDGRTEGRATVADVIFERLPASAQVPPDLRGRVSGNVSWNGRLDGSVKIASHLRSQASYGQPLTADVAIEGSVEPRQRRVDLRFRTSAETPGNAWLRSGSLRAEGTARGPWPPAIESTATVAASALLGALPQALQAQVRLSAAGGGSSVRMNGTFLGGSFEGTGRVVGSRLADVKLRATNLELQRVDSRLRGTGTLQVTASGAPANPTFDARLDLASVGYEQLALGDAAIDVVGTATASRWTLSAPALHVAGDGDLTTGKAGALTGRLTADRAPLATFASLLPELQGLEGIASAEAQLRVPLDAPRTAEIGARVSALEGRTPRFGPVRTEPFSIGYRAGRVELRDLRATAPGARARIEGSFGGEALSGSVRLDVALAEIEPRLEGASGTIGVDVRVDGVANRPRATGSVSLKDVVLEQPGGPHLRVADGAIRIEDNVAVVEDLKAELDGGALVLAGRAPVPAFVSSWRRDPKRVAPEEAADITLRWDGFDPGALLLRLRPASESRLTGSFTGSLAVRGGLSSLDEIEALLTSQAAEVAVGELTARLQPFEVRVAGSRATTEGIQVDAMGGTFRLSGGAGLADGQLDVTGRGRLDLRVLSPLLSDVALTGTADVDARLSGTTSAPDASGSLTLSGATARFRVLAQAITDIQASVVFDRNQARLERASALLGGGRLTATGNVALAQASLGTADVAIEGKDLALRYPEGLRSRLDADLKLTGRPGAFLLGGEVRVERALYDRDFQTTSFLTAVAVRDSPLLRSVALDLDVVTLAPLRVRNDTARLEATGQIKVRGDMQSPAPFGRVEIVAPGGQVTLLGARYAIDRGTISYDGTWDPQIDVEIRRRIRVRQGADVSTIPGEYTATITARGTVSEITREVLQLAVGGRVDERTETLRFSAEGPGDLDPSDVGHLALVGRTRSEAQAGRVAGEQAGTLVAGQLARKLKGLPFESITIQPELVSRETAQPDARFTFGAALLDGVDLTYSLSLTRPEDKLIQLEGRATRNLTALVKREYDLEERTDILTVGGGQRFELGGGPQRSTTRGRREESVELSEVELRGLDDPALAKLARDAIRAQAGKKTTAWRVQDDGDRIRESLLKRGYMDVEVGADLEGTLARFDVRAGRAYVTRVSGLKGPPDLSDVLRESLYEEEALEKGRAELLETLFDKGHWRASVTATANDEGALRVLHFAVEAGPVLKLGAVTFPGAVALGEDKLLSAAGGPGALVRAPQEARAAIRKEYEAIHYLEAQVLPPRVSEHAGVLEIEVAVEEGQRSLVSEVAFQGQSRPEAELRGLSRLQPGMPWDEERALLSVDAIRDDYYRNGWANARVHASHEDRKGGISLVYHVSEGRRLTVGRVEIAGLRGVRESFVRGNVDLKPGDPVDPAKLGRIERRLLALTVFSRVSSRWSDEDPSLVTFELQERARFGAGYDVRYSNVERLAGVLDGEVRNVFGRGLGLGARYQGSRAVDKLRGTLFVPSFPWKGDLQASVFREREEDFGEGETEVTRLQRGFQLQESVQLSSRTSLLFGYRFARTTISSPLLPFPSLQGVASLNLSGIRDTRDDVLDARTGRFVALNLTLAPSWIGSDQDFVKGLAQAFWSVPVGKRMTWAQGYRLGLAHVFNGEPLISTEGFRAGGSSTIRGFPSDALSGGLFGAQALVVLNQELRFRGASGIGAAVFYDTGQVFPTVRDFDFNWRHAVGAGLRYASPFGLLRLDVGFPLARKDGEKGYRIFFSLGQAF